MPLSTARRMARATEFAVTPNAVPEPCGRPGMTRVAETQSLNTGQRRRVTLNGPRSCAMGPRGRRETARASETWHADEPSVLVLILGV